MIVPEDYLDDDDDESDDDDTDYPGYPTSGADPRWTSPGIHSPHGHHADDEADSDDTDDSPDPSHKCVHCEKETYIQSETRKNTYNYCESCEDVTRHRRL